MMKTAWIIIAGLLLFGDSIVQNRAIATFPINLTDFQNLLSLRKKIIISYQSADWSDADSVFCKDSLESDNHFIVKTLWNNDSLYFRFLVKDSKLIAHQTEKDHPQLYLDDMVELLIDAHNEKNDCWNSDNIVYHINILGAKKDDRGSPDCYSDPAWDGEAKYSVQLFGVANDTTVTAMGYMVEIAVPWSEIGVEPRPGLAIGVNFANGDNDGDGRRLYNWSNAFPMRAPHCFGTLILSDRSRAAPYPS
jgi:hypothetical protein